MVGGALPYNIRVYFALGCTRLRLCKEMERLFFKIQTHFEFVDVFQGTLYVKYYVSTCSVYIPNVSFGSVLN